MFVAVNDIPHIQVKTKKPKAGPRIEFLGAVIHVLDNDPTGIAGLSTSQGQTENPPGLVNATRRSAVALIARIQELAGKLRVA